MGRKVQGATRPTATKMDGPKKIVPFPMHRKILNHIVLFDNVFSFIVTRIGNV